MKWGQRRYQNKDGSLTAAGRERYDDREKKASMHKDVKNRRLLSDADIKKKIERIKLEKELKSLTDDELRPGKKAVIEILSNSGKKVATTFLTGAALYAAKAALEQKISLKDLAGYVAPKPKNK
jgi:hypothetical protein